MNKVLLFTAAIVFTVLTSMLIGEEHQEERAVESVVVKLDAPRLKGTVSVEEAIYNRVSTRRFSSKELQKSELGQLLWSAVGRTVHGVTGPTRAYPSAGGINPLGAYAVVGNVNGVPAGIYHYDWENHSIHLKVEGDYRQALMEASYNQRMVAQASACVVITGNLNQVTQRYGAERGPRYLAMDVGAAGQNVHLQAEALNLGTVIVGAFHDNQVREILQLDEREAPFYIMPVGHFPESE